MRKKGLSKHVIVFLLTAVLMLSCIGTASAASLQPSEETVTETETALQETEVQSAQEESQMTLSMPEACETEQILVEKSLEAEEVSEAETHEAAVTQTAEMVETEESDVEADTTFAGLNTEVSESDNDDNLTGAVLEDGVYVYYENGEKAAKTGLAKAVDGTGWYYMADGTYDSSAEGICKRIDGVGGWYYVREGKYHTDLTGIAKKVDRTGGWYYVKNGVYKTNVTGISKKIDGTGGWYYVKNGVYTTSATGIAKKADGTGGWYYVKNGVYNTNVTGIAKRADGVGGWYYVKNGVYNTNATGIAKKADGTGGWYYVRKGVYKTDATGICKKADGTGGWYYVKNGVYNSNATGITWKADSTDTRFYYVQKGVYKSNASGIAKPLNGNPGWFYVRNGVYRPGASGIAKKADGSSNTWFYVSEGYYDTSFTGLARKADCSSNTQFYVKNGIFTKSNITSYDYYTGTYKIIDGVAVLKAGYDMLWVQDCGTTSYYHDGYTDVFVVLKIKNPSTTYFMTGNIEVTAYSPSDAELGSKAENISLIAPGETIYCTMHIDYEGEEPDFIGWAIKSDIRKTLSESPEISLVKVSQKTYEYGSGYTVSIKNKDYHPVWVCVSVVYYKNGQMVGGDHNTYLVTGNSTEGFYMFVSHEPDYDSYKLYLSFYDYN